jgi:hypothetical protein
MLLASCAKGGVEFVIETSGMDVDRVVLFVGVGDAYNEAILPMGRSAPYPKSSSWRRDHGNELDERAVNPDGPVVFQFQGGDKLGVVIAIGVRGETAVSAAVVRNIDVPGDSVARYELVLEPVNTTASRLELTAWESPVGSPKAGKQCVALFDKSTQSADAVVTEGDPDCDGWPSDDAKECQRNFYMSFGRPRLQDVACLVHERVVSNDGAINEGCVLGGPPCKDGEGATATGCTAPSAYCAPKSVCNRCDLAANDFDCARDVTTLVAPYPTHLRCKLYFDANGALCSSPFKAIANPPADIAGHFCKPDVQPVMIATAHGAWDTNVDFVAQSASLHVDVKNLQPSCNFDLQVSGAIVGANLFGAMVTGVLDNGRGLAYPIIFEANPLNIGCEFQTACEATWSWDFSELLDQCVNTPVFPP